MSTTDLHAVAPAVALDVDSEEQRLKWRQWIETALIVTATAAAVLFASVLSVMSGIT